MWPFKQPEPVVFEWPETPLRQVRWGTSSTAVRDRPWIDCKWAEVQGEVLAIRHADSDATTWVPLHVIRGEIEYRRTPAGEGGEDHG